MIDGSIKRCYILYEKSYLLYLPQKTVQEVICMKKVAVVYWSGSGNTEEMAKAVAEGAKKGGADVTLTRFEDFKVDDMAGYDGFLFGCPATGTEELQEDYVEPFFVEAEAKLSGVPLGLFGSYGWGGGAFMETWAERVRTAGAKLVSDGLTVENAPDDDGRKACEELGETLAKSL